MHPRLSKSPSVYFASKVKKTPPQVFFSLYPAPYHRYTENINAKNERTDVVILEDETDIYGTSPVLINAFDPAFMKGKRNIKEKKVSCD